MKYIKFSNKGLLDIRLISLMGGSTKRGNDYKIGRFGSGLKYSLAWLIRNNVDFKIFVGEDMVNIQTKTEVIQGTSFDILYINGERSSISSSMGVDWEAWQIVREIFCNALDEGEYIKEITDLTVGQNGWTTFYIQLIDGIKETVDNWDNYFLHNRTPIYDCKEFAIYPAQEKLSIFKNGVLIHRDKDAKKGIFSYDIKAADINELREYKGYLTFDINECIKNLDRKSVELFLTFVNDESTFENGMEYYTFGSELKDTWKEALGQGRIIAQKDLDTFRARGVQIDETSLVPLPTGLFKILAHKFDNISAVRRADKVGSFYETFDAELELKTKAACAILESCGYEIHPELRFIFGEFGDKTTWARINRDEKIIMFSNELKRKTMFEIVTTVIEEIEHYRTNLEDCSRPFQQHFINLYTKELLERNEVKM